MHRPAATLLLAAAAGACLASAQAQAQSPAGAPGSPQVIEPQVARREVPLPRFPSRDFELGAFVGTYATESFGSAFVYGLRLGYHITEDFFVHAAYGQTEVSDDTFRQILPGGVFVNRTETLKYYNVSAGYNVISGEAFFGRHTARPLQGYLIAGVGSTDFAGQKKQTLNVGFGLRLFLHDRLALQADVRDHLYSLDLLGKSQSTQNLEVTVGLSTFF